MTRVNTTWSLTVLHQGVAEPVIGNQSMSVGFAQFDSSKVYPFNQTGYKVKPNLKTDVKSKMNMEMVHVSYIA